MAKEVIINTNHNPKDTSGYPWVASIETKEHGMFYGYGTTEQSAIKQAENEMNFWGRKQ